MSEFETDHAAKEVKEAEVRHLPIHIDWSFETDSTKSEERSQKLDDLINNVKDNWLTETQLKSISKRFHDTLTQLEIDLETEAEQDPEKDVKKPKETIFIKLTFTHAAFDLSITTKDAFRLIFEPNHNQKL